MISRQRTQSGFTIVELLIVIVVIGILAGLVLNTFNGIQARARDTERRTDVNAIHAQLEAYHADNGYYPTNTDMTGNATAGAADTSGASTGSGTVIGDEMEGLDTSALADPTSGGYDYVTTPATCNNTTTLCTSYTLFADLESDDDGLGEAYDDTGTNGDDYFKNSLN